MQTSLTNHIKASAFGKEADSILRSCVHCGFCNATCPTYQELGDELDGPRGRIYLIKQLLEGAKVTERTRGHLDRCLTCLNCETTCPSGVRYRRLVEIGREVIEERARRPVFEQLQRWGIRKLLAYPTRFRLALFAGRLFSPLLPEHLRPPKPSTTGNSNWPDSGHARVMLILDGCAQPVLSPNINAATARVLDQLGITLKRIHESGCCGALSMHLNAVEEAKDFARRNIDAWWPSIEAGAEAIVITASGCGTQMKDYGRLLADDPAYAERANQVAKLARDLSEVFTQLDTTSLSLSKSHQSVAFQCPCSLQHGQQLSGIVESILQGLGFKLASITEPHLCCGSAGSYSMLQPELSQRLRKRKLKNLTINDPDMIATANIGCLHHLQGGTELPVKHWIEIVDQALDATE